MEIKMKMKTLLGNVVEIDPCFLNRNEVEKRAAEFFGFAVKCEPGVFGHNTVAPGWRCRRNKDNQIVGYLHLTTGDFCRVEDYEYPINVFMPFGKISAQIYGNEMCYTGKSLAIFIMP